MPRLKNFKLLFLCTVLVNLSLAEVSWAGQGRSCRAVFLTPQKKLEKKLLNLSRKGFDIELGRKSIKITHPKNKSFLAQADLRMGILSLGLSFRKTNGKLKVKGLRGSDFFEMAMSYFAGDIQYIRGYWRSGINLEKINRITSIDKTLDIEDIALETWTGRQAGKYGFKKVWLVRKAGASGDYRAVIIDFYR